mmetsp:Transcript_4729/g.19271  ORF Transcript_4729/g.19271 Transcript_4729/m.19271 type:complete len:260 (-) Transcript_4729:653-1432(-)
MAEGDRPDGAALSRRLLRGVLRPRRLARDLRLDRGRPALDARRDPRALVRHLGPARLPRRVPRLPQGTDRVPRQVLEHPAPRAGGLVVRLAAVHRRRRRRPPLRRVLRRALLHPQLHVDGPVLLRLRLHLPRLPHPLRHVRADHHGPPLLPALRRRLPLVVAHLPHLGLDRALRLPLLGLLLLETRVQHAGHLRPLLWLHGHHRRRPLPAHGHHRLLRGPLVQHHHLLLDQGRLDGGRRGANARRPSARGRRRRGFPRT